MDDGNTETTPAVSIDGSSLKISLSNAGPTKEITVVRIDGVVDAMTAGELERVISSLITRKRYRLVLDLAGVDYISSAGWGIFVSHLREIREHAGDIKLARMTPEVREIYELLEFDGLLPAYDRLDAAETGFYHGSTPTAAGKPPPKEVAPQREIKTETAPESGSSETELPPETTIEQAVLRLVAEDPFYTISEIRDELKERYNGRFRPGWWRVMGCLRRHHLLTRRARFRFFRRAHKTAV